MSVVDIHTHFIPPAVVEAATRGAGPDGIRADIRDGVPWFVHRQGYAYPVTQTFHQISHRVADMDRVGTSHAVLSVPPTLFLYWADPDEAAAAAISLNDGLAAATAEGGQRFSALATLPMQDPVAAAAELRRAVVDLGFVGASIGPHVEGRALDSDEFAPVLESADELEVPLLLHPYYVGANPELSDFYLTNLLGNPWQTTVAATRLILSGTLQRLPRLRIILVHGGGYLAAALGRLDHGWRVRPELAHLTTAPSSLRHRFFYDTLTHDPHQLRSLVDAVGAGQVVFGSDAPFDMGNPAFAGQIEGADLSENECEQIAFANAASLFGLAH